MRHHLAEEAKAIVAIAFRNGLIEDLHAGAPCPTCAEDPDYSRISDTEMKAIMKNAVDWVFHILHTRDHNPVAHANYIRHGLRYTGDWDEPQEPAALVRKRNREEIERQHAE